MLCNHHRSSLSLSPSEYLYSSSFIFLNTSSSMMNDVKAFYSPPPPLLITSRFLACCIATTDFRFSTRQRIKRTSESVLGVAGLLLALLALERERRESPSHSRDEERPDIVDENASKGPICGL